MRQTAQIHIDGLAQPILVRKNPRARRFTLRVNQTNQQAVLTLPPRAKLDEAKTFVASNAAWLQKQLDKIPTAIPFKNGNKIPLRGEDYLLYFVSQRARRGIVAIDKIDGHPALFVHGNNEHAPRRLLDWLKKEAKKDLEARVTWHANNLKLKPKRITIRDQRSRWGSCSSTGALSFSWRLILAPEFVLDYVAAHEVAHLEEMNHGPRFWELVKQTNPTMEEAQYWLKTHGASLHRYGPIEG